MRLLYVLRYWPTRSETFVAREIEELQRRGHEVVVAAIGRRADGEGLDPVPGLEVWRPPRGLGRVRTWASRRQVSADSAEAVAQLASIQRPKDVARACWVAERAAERDFDRVHAHFAGEAAEWARLIGAVAGVPWSVTAHATDLFVPRPSLAGLLRGARPVVTVCEHHRAHIVGRFEVEARVVRCGVDPRRFEVDPAVRVRRDGRRDAPLSVLAVARWVPKKGLDTLLEAIELVPEPLVLRLVSDAPASVTRAGVEVGPLPPAEVGAALARADLFALPCRVAADGDRDGVPVALMEAMAAGLPVVSTPVSGIPELVDHAVGWLVPPDDPEALAEAISEAARDAALRAAKGAAARRRIAEEWTVERQVDGLLDAWECA